MNKPHLVVIVAMLSVGSATRPGSAATVTPTSDDDHRATYAPGSVTRDWLRLQREGGSAGAAQGLPGDAATLIYQRYLNSFKNPIPAQFEGQRGAGAQ